MVLQTPHSHHQPLPRWQAPILTSKRLPARLLPWLTHADSLTARLKVHSQGAFGVQVLRQGWGLPRADEARRAAMKPRQQALIREVLLMGKGQPWVYARSILPATSLQGPLRYLRQLDSRPLGSLLFQYPGMYRDQIEITQLDLQYVQLPATAQVDGLVWGRRSCFYLQQKPFLVSEFFLNPFCDTLTP